VRWQRRLLTVLAAALTACAAVAEDVPSDQADAWPMNPDGLKPALCVKAFEVNRAATDRPPTTEAARAAFQTMQDGYRDIAARLDDDELRNAATELAAAAEDALGIVRTMASRGHHDPQHEDLSNSGPVLAIEAAFEAYPVLGLPLEVLPVVEEHCGHANVHALVYMTIERRLEDSLVLAARAMEAHFDEHGRYAAYALRHHTPRAGITVAAVWADTTSFCLEATYDDPISGYPLSAAYNAERGGFEHLGVCELA
jgi:hypothetical protein